MRCAVLTLSTQSSVEALSALRLISCWLILTSGWFIGCDRGAPSSSQVLDQGVILEDEDSWWLTDRFQDHTVEVLADAEMFSRLAKSTETFAVLKFWLTEPVNGLMEGWSERAVIRYYDSAFYNLHDQLYWYRLLNGAPVWGFETTPLIPPVETEDIASTIGQMTRLRESGADLPLELRFTANGRLYAPHFYERVLGDPRRVILGSILHIQAHEERSISEDIWAFELEYSDQPTSQEILSLFAYFDAHLPPSIGPLRWLTRSPNQVDLGRSIIDAQQVPNQRIISYQDLIVPGEAEVYSAGITAGRLRLMSQVDGMTEERDILLYDELPDDLPACRGLISSIPQTPLSHINLLARNRGIPNIYSAGVTQQPSITQLANARAPVLLWGQAPSDWRVIPLSNDEYRQYLSLRTTPPRSVSRPPLGETPLTLSLDRTTDEEEGQLDPYWTIAELLDFRPYIGGKSSGVLMIERLLTVDSQETEDHTEPGSSLRPPQPILALTGEAYAQHIEPLIPLLSTLLNDESWLKRHELVVLALEGWAGYWSRAPQPSTPEEVRAWFTSQSEAVRGLIERGGVKGWIRQTPIEPTLREELLSLLHDHFSELDPAQGLRFRSSSNVEDLEGFNGAGLYGSYTGYLYPHVQSSPQRRGRTITRALREVWSSYWNVEAFEERSSEGIDHLEGWMGVLIHPCFQDDLELANGVMTLTLAPQTPQELGHPSTGQPSSLTDWEARAVINSQLGSESVTNPSDSTLLTELIEVTEVNEPIGSKFTIHRQQQSSLTPEVLSDNEITRLVDQALSLTLVWREAVNQQLTSPQRFHTFTLDLEYRLMAPSWPLKRTLSTVDSTLSSQIILKQARPLEPDLRAQRLGLNLNSIPLDLSRRALRIREWQCRGEEIEISALQLYSDPLSSPLMGFEDQPFTGELIYTDSSLGARQPGRSYRLTHRDFSVLESSTSNEESLNQWRLALYRRASRDLPFEYIHIDQQERTLTWSPRSAQGQVTQEERRQVSCVAQTLYASPQEYLYSLLNTTLLNDQSLE